MNEERQQCRECFERGWEPPPLTREQARILLNECEAYSDQSGWPYWTDEDGDELIDEDDVKYEAYAAAKAALRRIAEAK